MLKFNLLLIFIIAVKLTAQPELSQYYLMAQKDSSYYLLTNNALLKFYSHEASGEFFMTKYIEKNFPPARLEINDEYLLLSYNDSIFCYSNKNIWDLTFEGVSASNYSVTSIHGFGPYFFIRSGDTYHLIKIENGLVIPVEDSLFNHPPQYLVFFTYPYVVIAGTVYKYVEGFDFYPVAQISVSNVNTGITGNEIIAYFYRIIGPPPIQISDKLFKTKIEEPDFPRTVYNSFGYTIPQLHIDMGNGLMIAKKKLYYMTWAKVITTYDARFAYSPSVSDRVTITDNYIFLLGGDTLKYSKWDNGSVFYPFTWTDLTDVPHNNAQPYSYSLSQNYPNPFNTETVIKFEISNTIFVSLKVYNILGEEIISLVNGEKAAGKYQVHFDGSKLQSGTYFYRLQAGEYVGSKKMILLK